MGGAQLVLIADDFTGANDTGVQFSKRGLRTVVVTDSAQMARASQECDVLVIDTETRLAKADAAYEKVLQVSKLLRGSTALVWNGCTRRLGVC
ncbi:MAG TPA: four-carbon acid sugar kinase family protein [Firmicutes bacterium]|jgi:uncharacterized protein YgbK (DUF1537 family)|nr:four-carbon acid sugar kinase family protein [Bacillota bacterium]